MGIGDKISNKAEEVKGQAKESYGDATDNHKLEAEGKGDQAKANMKQAIIGPLKMQSWGVQCVVNPGSDQQLLQQRAVVKNDALELFKLSQ